MAAGSGPRGKSDWADAPVTSFGRWRSAPEPAYSSIEKAFASPLASLASSSYPSRRHLCPRRYPRSADCIRPRRKRRFRQRPRRNRTYLLGLLFALTSPWNIGFWLAVVGGQRTFVTHPSLPNSVALAGCVVLGAMAWGIVICTALRFGARFFAEPAWQIGTQALSALVMIWFAVNLAVHLGHGRGTDPG